MYLKYTVITTRAIMETIGKIPPMPDMDPERPPDSMDMLKSGMTLPQVREVNVEWEIGHTLQGARYKFTEKVVVASTWNYEKGIPVGRRIMNDWPLILLDDAVLRALEEDDMRMLTETAAGEGLWSWDEYHGNDYSKAYDIFMKDAVPINLELKLDNKRYMGFFERRAFRGLFTDFKIFPVFANEVISANTKHCTAVHKIKYSC
ncbi:hypothetical protein QBC38DRAFT_516020 [Podospora fimiseda]|uniref:Uncharacterized protein n=1 Tax=Podospora fimiseda TaxID=252190 RepID=A0AAN7BIJ6_9PEZI|nr:hypothetical protein QBC38DRAFT_516020 [Podospora fimiseda]